MPLYEQNYLSLLHNVFRNGEVRPSRVGATHSLFGTTIEIPDLIHGSFPLLTTRKMSYAGVFGELAAFVRGSTKVSDFKKWGCNYWDYNAAAWRPNYGLPPEEHIVGRIYGVQWRDWEGEVDQLARLVDGIKSDPNGRRHILTTWNPSDLDLGCLPPCHIMAQFYVSKGQQLDCMVYMRSVDLCLGLPSDVVLYAALLCLVAKDTGYLPGMLKFSFGDTHVYANHVEGMLSQIYRKPLTPPAYSLAVDATVFNFQPDDITILDYQPHEGIKYELN